MTASKVPFRATRHKPKRKRPFGDAQQAVRYLGHYTHRVAISNHRLVSLVDDQVTFRWRDSTINTS